MATLKRRAANLFTRLTGLNLSRKGEGWKLMELEALSRFLSAFQVDCVFEVGANTGQYGADSGKSDITALLFPSNQIRRLSKNWRPKSVKKVTYICLQRKEQTAIQVSHESDVITKVPSTSIGCVHFRSGLYSPAQ